MPMLLLLLVFSLLFIFAQSAAIAPFIYTLYLIGITGSCSSTAL
jgi:hypothetical protein